MLLEKQGGATTAAYTYGNALIRKDGETPLFDGLGSERTVTNSSGAIQGTLTTSAFGQTIASSGSSTSAYQFGATSGYRTEGDAGLTLVGCRFYDAQVGRFITRDTYLDQKPYAYCDGDPVNRLDSTGHDWSIQDTRDWANQMDDIGTKEVLLGGTIITGGCLGGFGPDSPIPGIPTTSKPTWPGWTPGLKVTPKPTLKSVTGVFAAVGGGLVVGGLIAKGVAWIMNTELDW